MNAPSSKIAPQIPSRISIGAHRPCLPPRRQVALSHGQYLTAKGIGKYKLDSSTLFTEAGRWWLARDVVGNAGDTFDLVEGGMGELSSSAGERIFRRSVSP